MLDPYIEKGVLRNRLDITDYKTLKQAEADICFLNLIELEGMSVDKNNSETIKMIHKRLFNQIYDWAGEYRTIPLSKLELVVPGLNLKYTEPVDIPDMLEQKIADMESEDWNSGNLDDFAEKLAKHSTEIWKVHPFRDGNTRCVLAYMYLFSKQCGVEFNLSNSMKILNRVENTKTGKVKKWSLRDLFVLSVIGENDLEKLVRESISVKEVEKEDEGIEIE